MPVFAARRIQLAGRSRPNTRRDRNNYLSARLSKQMKLALTLSAIVMTVCAKMNIEIYDPADSGGTPSTKLAVACKTSRDLTNNFLTSGSCTFGRPLSIASA